MSKQGKTTSESAVEQNVYKVFPNDLNSKYTVFGGLVMSLCDRVALIVAERHSGRPSVTAAGDSLNSWHRRVRATRWSSRRQFIAPGAAQWRSACTSQPRTVPQEETGHVVSAYL